MIEKNCFKSGKVNLGKLIDISNLLLDKNKVGSDKISRMPPMKVYPLPKGGKDSMGKSDHYQETSSEREEYTKG